MSQHCNSSRTKVEEIVTIILNFCEEYGGKRKDEPLLFGKAKYRRYIQAEKEALINNLSESRVDKEAEVTVEADTEETPEVVEEAPKEEKKSKKKTTEEVK
jgi:hypothetical protein